jgi:hypothetical protein
LKALIQLHAPFPTKIEHGTVSFRLAQRLILAHNRLRHYRPSLAIQRIAGYQPRDEQDLTLVTYWRAGVSILTPLQMFVHVLGPMIDAQQDRLDVPAFGGAEAMIRRCIALQCRPICRGRSRHWPV